MSAVPDSSSRTFIGSVVFVDIIGYSKKTVSEQIVLKDRFTALLADVLADIPHDQRLILDTGDGAALSFLGDPEDALFVSMHMRDLLRQPDQHEGQEPIPLRVGINLGPVKLVRDINGHPNIVGDGINVAQRIMGFASEGQIVVSRSFYDVVSVISDSYAKLFRYEGSRTDKHIREHEIYVVGESVEAFDRVKAGAASRAAMSSTNAFASAALGSTSGGFDADGTVKLSLLQDPRRLMTLVALPLAAIVLALGLYWILTKKGPPPAEMAAATGAPAAPVVAIVPPPATASSNPADPAKTAEQTASPANSATSGLPAAPVSSPASGASPQTDAKPRIEPKADAKPEGKSEPKSDAKAPMALGTLNLQINPWGEVLINGKAIGVSPPIKQHKLAPGKYKIEVRNATFTPYVAQVEVKAREEVVIRHTFR
ncbi:MAG TPA: PEGA domain-containing protein [Usitatibacteraceae bacterium]|nr:PEGA domain-containing protein [Usitatibacteraceae bacterium]